MVIQYKYFDMYNYATVCDFPDLLKLINYKTTSIKEGETGKYLKISTVL